MVPSAARLKFGRRWFFPIGWAVMASGGLAGIVLVFAYWVSPHTPTPSPAPPPPPQRQVAGEQRAPSAAPEGSQIAGDAQVRPKPESDELPKALPDRPAPGPSPDAQVSTRGNPTPKAVADQPA